MISVVKTVPLDAADCWIPVAERVPEPLADVLVAWAQEKGGPAVVDMAYRKPDGRWALSGLGSDIYIEPTHWMCLPAPPDE